MAGVSLENWQERIRDPKIECMSRDEMSALQSEKLVKQVKRVYENVPFYRKKMQQISESCLSPQRRTCGTIIPSVFWQCPRKRSPGCRVHPAQQAS